MLNHEQKFPSKRGFVIYIPLVILAIVETVFVAGGSYSGAILILSVMAGSAPALSLDRLELFYNQFDSVVISPVDKAVFIAKLRKLNPGINY